MRVVVTERINEAGIDLIRSSGVTVDLLYENSRSIDDALSGADGVIVRIAEISREVMARAESLKVIGKHGIGVNNIDLDAAKDFGVRVVYTPGHMANAVAEATIGLLLLLARNFPFYDRECRRGNWKVRYSQETDRRNRELGGKTLGLVGCGRIGELVARIASSMGMRILVYDPYIQEKPGPFELVDLPRLLSQSDFVSIHCPLNAETRGLIGKKEMGMMKNGAYIVNTARGGIVVESDLCDAIKRGKISGAALDTTENEPVELDDPLLSCSGVVLTCHTAGLTYEASVRMARQVARQVLMVLNGEEPEFAVI